MNEGQYKTKQRGMSGWAMYLVVAAFSVALLGCPLFQTEVPDVVGLAQDAAEEAILAAGLVVGDVTEEAVVGVAPGVVIAQDPEAGAAVAAGSAVDLVVSAGPATVVVPNVVGLQEAAAEAALQAVGLVPVPTIAFDPDVPAGEVVSQAPVAGTEVDEGSAVNFLVSLGPELVEVPDVVGMAEAAAEAAIAAAELVADTTYAYSDTVAAGQVISQNPAAGTDVEVGSTVAIVVSEGPEPVEVPDVVGQAEAVAEALIEARGLVVGDVAGVFNDVVPLGDVISQNPAGGTMVDAGSEVDLVVSLGPVLVDVPDVAGRTEADAVVLIEGSNLVVGEVTRVRHATVPEGHVIEQTPAGGTMAPMGSAVDLVVSDGPAPVEGSIAITTIEQLESIGRDPMMPRDGSYHLIHDIDASATWNWDFKQGFDPLRAFAGRFDGQGYSIFGLTINRPEEDMVGLFGDVKSGAVIQDLTLVSSTVRGYYAVGSLAGINEGTIYNCSVVDGAQVASTVVGSVYVGGLVGVNGIASTSSNGPASTSVTPVYSGVLNSTALLQSVEGYDNVGGLVGVNGELATIRNCSTNTLVNALHGFEWGYPIGEQAETGVGGLVGANLGQVVGSSAMGDVSTRISGNVAAGGLVGWNLDSLATIQDNCFAMGRVTGQYYVGGLVGANWGGRVTHAYATGNVDGISSVGGLVGDNWTSTIGVPSIIERCYATGSVLADMISGGLVGWNDMSRIHASWADGNVTGRVGVLDEEESYGDIGGLVGYNTGLIDKCYANGNVRGVVNVGGLVGLHDGGVNGLIEVDQIIIIADAVISQSYASGEIQAYSTTSPGPFGGLVGANLGGLVGPPAVRCFYDRNTCGPLVPPASDFNYENGEEATTAQLKSLAWLEAAGWDVVGTWEVVGGQYPTLRVTPRR